MKAFEKTDDLDNPALKGISPVATGDGPKWVEGQPTESMFSLYSTSVAGIFGAIVSTTEVEGILALNCNVTDFYAANYYPEILYYNPYSDSKTVSYYSTEIVDLFDIVSKTYMAKGKQGKVSISLSAGEAVIIVHYLRG